MEYDDDNESRHILIVKEWRCTITCNKKTGSCICTQQLA